jgi:N6-L-threonylcarbamoyladenine synthase
MLEKAGFEIHRKELPGHMPVIRLSDDGYFNLSGAETKLLRCIDGGISDEDARLLITEMFISIADLLYGAARDLAERYSAGNVYMAGGVASSMTVRKLISLKAESRNIIFGDPDLSGDNAVGIALLARRSHETGKRFTGK